MVRGLSMMPTLRPGWSVAVRPVGPTRLGVGDVAAFSRESRLIAHRVVAAIGWGRRRILIEKGDGLPQIRRLRAEGVVGRVEEVLDDRGRRVPPSAWQWTRGKRLTVSSVVLLRLLVTRGLALLGIGGLTMRPRSGTSRISHRERPTVRGD